MSVDSMTQVVENIQSVYTIILALAIAEAFNQAIRENKPQEEQHSTTLIRWFDCFHHARFISLIVFLMLAVPFFQGNQKYLYLQYVEPLHQASPPKSISARWLDFDCLVFTVQAGLFFVMSRSLSARRWQQFYGTIMLLLAIDFIWASLEKWHGADVPHEWLWFDIVAVIILAAIIVLDWFFIKYEKDKELNIYCYVGISIVAILGMVYGYFYEFDYLIDY